MEKQEDLNTLLNVINCCEVRELSKNFDEFNYEVESARFDSLNASIKNLREHLKRCKIEEKFINNLMSDIYYLYIELQTKGPWNSDKGFAKNIQNDIQKIYNIDIEKVLCKNSVCNKQLIFDKCIQTIHRKLSKESYKKNPSTIEVYCILCSKLKDYDVKINPMTLLPISLILIQDHTVEVKIKGLICCKNIFENLSLGDFGSGNYYEVFIEILYKQLSLKDIKLNHLIFECMYEVIRILPGDESEKKCDNFFMYILNEIFMTSDFKNKKILFSGLIKLISIHQLNSAKRKKKLFIIIQENLDLCVDISARTIIFNEVIETLQIWLKHCWCLWKFSDDKKILSTLFKLLFVVNNKETDFINKINCIILLLFKLSMQDEQKIILLTLDSAYKKIDDTMYLSRLENVRKLCIKG